MKLDITARERRGILLFASILLLVSLVLYCSERQPLGTSDGALTDTVETVRDSVIIPAGDSTKRVGRSGPGRKRGRKSAEPPRRRDPLGERVD